jgi:polar amino acid transport system substrate-binding protein
LLLRWLLLGMLLALAPLAQAERVVRIGTGDWVPYVDQHRADAGALARLVKAVFAAAGYQVEFVFYPWDRNVLMLQQGALDAIMPYSCSPMRLDYGVCSEPLVRGQIVLFHRKDLAFDWTRVEDLKNYRIGTTLGYSYGHAAHRAEQQGRHRLPPA